MKDDSVAGTTVSPRA